MITQEDIIELKILSSELREAKDKYQSKKRLIAEKLYKKEEVEKGRFLVRLEPNVRISWKEFVMREIGADTVIQRKSIEEKAKAQTLEALKESGSEAPKRLIISRRK